MLTLKTSHRPDGKMADMPKSTLIFRFGLIFGSIRDLYVPATPANFPSPQWDFHMFCALCLQGGGVYISSGTVSFSSCTITGNTAYWVRAQAQKSSHRPDGKIADVLALTHACTTANSSVNYRRYVPRRPSKVPIAPMGKCLAFFELTRHSFGILSAMAKCPHGVKRMTFQPCTVVTSQWHRIPY